MQVRFVVEACQGYGIEAIGAVCHSAVTALTGEHHDVTHLLFLHGEEAVQRFRATVFALQKRRVDSLEAVFELLGPLCLSGIRIEESISPAA